MTIHLENLQADNADYRFDLTFEIECGTAETVEEGVRPEHAGRPYIRLDADDGSGEYLSAMIWDEASADELLNEVQAVVEDFKRRLKNIKPNESQMKDANAPEKN
jgi:hypothetical protein